MPSQPHPHPKNTTIALLPASPTDIPIIITLQNLAFANNPIRHLMWPGGMPEATFLEYLSRHRIALRDDPNFYVVKAVVLSPHSTPGNEENSTPVDVGAVPSDSENQILVGSALYRLHRPGKMTEEWDREDREKVVECGVKMSPRPDVFNEIERGLQAVRRKVRGEGVFWELLHLDTHPKYERRGIGSRLVRWGIDKSEESEIPLYLESTEIGAPLYERFGFTEVDRLTLDVEKWAEFGARGTYSYHFMIREPRSRARV